jgi:hypothetical protein
MVIWMMFIHFSSVSEMNASDDAKKTWHSLRSLLTCTNQPSNRSATLRSSSLDAEPISDCTSSMTNTGLVALVFASSSRVNKSNVRLRLSSFRLIPASHTTIANTTNVNRYYTVTQQLDDDDDDDDDGDGDGWRNALPCLLRNGRNLDMQSKKELPSNTSERPRTFLLT